MCTYCPAGYNCNVTGISEYQLHPCPLYKFCLPNALNNVSATPAYSSMHDCPAGYYGNATKLTEKFGCLLCPAGSWCDPATSTTPIACTPGTECLEGSELEVTCQGGYYCNATTTFAKTDCPVNNFCFPGVGESTRCAAGVICPVNTLAGTK